MNHIDTVLEEVWRVKDDLSNRHADMSDLMALLREQRVQFDRSTPSNQSDALSVDNNNSRGISARQAQTGVLLKAMGL